VETATKWFAGLGAEARGLMLLGRRDALDQEMAGQLRQARQGEV